MDKMNYDKLRILNGWSRKFGKIHSIVNMVGEQTEKMRSYSDKTASWLPVA